jgi:hypothetical protein
MNGHHVFNLDDVRKAVESLRPQNDDYRAFTSDVILDELGQDVEGDFRDGSDVASLLDKLVALGELERDEPARYADGTVGRSRYRRIRNVSL